MGVKHSKLWQKFQWFESVTPRYHWSLKTRIPELAGQYGLEVINHRAGCFTLQRPEA